MELSNLSIYDLYYLKDLKMKKSRNRCKIMRLKLKFTKIKLTI